MSGALVVAPDDHALRGLPAAGGGQRPLALDVDHAGPAVAVRPIARLIAEMRDVDADALPGLEDGLVRQGMDLAAVQGEGDGLGFG